MTKAEWRILYGYYNASKPSQWKATSNSISGRRSTKNKAKHVGFVLKNSRIIPQVRIER